MNSEQKRAHSFRELIARLHGGKSPTDSNKVVDLGCGSGELVYWLRSLDIDAHGCDFQFKDGPYVEQLFTESYLSQISGTPYTLPYADESVDVVISDQVIEHVIDLRETNKEIARVLKNGGICLHIFPSRYTPLEPHIGVPFATIIQNRAWLKFWHTLGIGRRAGAHTNADIVTQNLKYLRTSTCYRTHAEVDRLMFETFGRAGNAEQHFLAHRFAGTPIMAKLAESRFASLLYRLFRDRVIFAEKIS